MKKVKTVGTIGEFMSGNNKKGNTMHLVITAAGPALVLLSPTKILADATPGAVAVIAPQDIDADKTFKDIYDAIMAIFDAGVVLVIIFAGAAWGLGHRSKAIEILIGVCCGYILARHAIDIRDFLKGIGGN